MCRGFVTLILILFWSSGAAAGAEPRMVFAQPGGPGSTEQAQPVMAEFATALAAGRAELGGLTAVYFNTAKALEDDLGTGTSAFAALSLDAFLRLRKRHGLVPIARAVPAGPDRLRYHVIVASAGPADLAGLAGKRLTRSGLSDVRFISAVVLGGGPDAAKRFTLQTAKRPLRAIRDVLRGKADGALIDGATLRALTQPEAPPQLKKYAAQIKTIFTSADLPTAPVAQIGGRGPAKALRAALLDLAGRGEAKKLLETFTLSGFAEADARTYATVIKAYDTWKPPAD